MCFATMAIASSVMGAAGAGLKAYGTLEEGKAIANAANYSAQVATNNSAIAKQNADYAIAAGEVAAANQSLKGAARLGKVKAQQAASGIDVNTDTAVDVQTGERAAEKLDTETVLHNAQLTGYGYRTQATNFEAESQLQRMKADKAKKAAKIGAVSSLLSDASSMGFKWAGSTGGGTPGGGSGFVGNNPWDSSPGADQNPYG